MSIINSSRYFHECELLNIIDLPFIHLVFPALPPHILVPSQYSVDKIVLN